MTHAAEGAKEREIDIKPLSAEVEVRQRVTELTEHMPQLKKLPHPSSLMLRYKEPHENQFPVFEVQLGYSPVDYFPFSTAFEANTYAVAVSDVGNAELYIRRYDQSLATAQKQDPTKEYTGLIIDHINTAEGFKEFLDAFPRRMADFSRMIDQHRCEAEKRRLQNDKYWKDYHRDMANAAEAQLINLVLKRERLNSFRAMLVEAGKNVILGIDALYSVFLPHFFPDRPIDDEWQNLSESLISQRDKKALIVEVVSELGLKREQFRPFIYF